jgi:tetratricopeptide (TPR) repeat protein
MRVLVTLLLVASVLAASCATGIDMDYYRDVDDMLAQGRGEEAARLVKSAGRDVYGDRNRLLYHLDLALAYQVAGQYKESAGQFETADGLAADLYTKSLSGEAASLFTNDLSIPYAGEDFERILLNVFNAMNYVMMGDAEGALVEARRIDTKFTALEQEKGRYDREALALYLSGMLYENGDELDNAYISYSKAASAYDSHSQLFELGVPHDLVQDVAYLGRRLSMDVPQALLDAAGEVLQRQDTGEVVVLHYFGPGPRKVEQSVEVSLGEGFAIVQSVQVDSQDEQEVRKTLSAAKGMLSTTQVTIAYPVFKQPALACHSASVTVQGCGSARSDLVANISRTAALNLEDRMGRVWSRIVARAVLKFITARTAGNIGEQATGNEGVGLLVQLFTQAALSATEEADLRGWRTIPAQVQMTRVRCPAGQYRVRVENEGAAGPGTYREYEGVEVVHGRKTFLIAECY